VNRGNSSERLIQFLQATPEQQELVGGILDGRSDSKPSPLIGPLLLGMGAGAKLLGVSRATLWRMIKAGKLTKVEVLPGSFRVRRTDIEALAGSHSENQSEPKNGSAVSMVTPPFSVKA
jgi:excisionase family DNA binding protein